MNETDIREIVQDALRASAASAETMALWGELADAYANEGPDGVKALLNERVKNARKRASKEAKDMSDVAGTVAKPKKPKGRK